MATKENTELPIFSSGVDDCSSDNKDQYVEPAVATVADVDAMFNMIA